MKTSKFLPVFLSVCMLFSSMPVMAAEPEISLGGIETSSQEETENPVEVEVNTPEDEKISMDDGNVEEQQSVVDENAREDLPETNDGTEEKTPAVNDGAEGQTPDTEGSNGMPVMDSDETTDAIVNDEISEEEPVLSDEAETPSQDTEGVLANGDVEVNEINFPDEVFRNYIIAAYTYSTSGTPILEFAHRSRVTSMDLSSSNLSGKLTSLKGIQYFPALSSLNCAENELTELDVTGLKNLTSLICNDNQITTLTLEGCTSLRQLYCWNNKIENLDLRALVNLEEIQCHNNDITQLDISKNSKLEHLSCQNILVSNLDFSQNQNLKYLSCGGNNLVSIDFNDNIKTLGIYNSENIEELDFSNLTQLESVGFYTNSYGETEAFKNLTKMDFTGCTSLEKVGAANNSVETPKLASVILSGNTSLTKLGLKSEMLTSIDLSDCTSLTDLKIYNAPLIQLNVRAALLLEKLELTKANLAEGFMLYCWKYTPAETYAKNHGINYDAAEYDNYATVTYVTNCDETIEPKVLMPGSKITEPALSPSDGSKVLGWYTDSDYKQRFDFANMVVTADITLHAKIVSNEKIYINEETFPDEKFREYLISGLSNWGVKVEQNYGVMEDGSMGYITTGYYLDASSRTKSIYGSIRNMEITSLKGIEYFEGLYNLDCSMNGLTELDLSKNIMLEKVSCDSNNLTELDLSNNVTLTEISCGNNALTNLILPETNTLTSLSCGSNELTSLDLSKNPALISLYCGYNEIASLDLGNNIELKTLDCSENQLQQLNIAGNPNLESVNCGKNESLSRIDVSSAAKLRSLYCSDNNMEALDVSNNPELTTLNCSGNSLNELNVNANTRMTYLSCNDNQLTNLDLSENTLLTYLSCGKNQFASLDLSKNTKLTYLSCGQKQLENLDVSKCTELADFQCHDSGLTFIDLRYNKMLTGLDLGYSDDGNDVLTGIDLRTNNCILPGANIPDTVTVYCTEGTWIATWCKTWHTNYSFNDPSEEDSDEPNPPVDPDLPEVGSNDLKYATVTLTASYIKVKKNNAAQKPVPKKVTLNGKTLKKNTDYTISYTATSTENGVTTTKAVDSLTTVGRYTMILSAVSGGSYTGSRSCTIVVTDKKLMSSVKVTVNKKEYTGEAITSDVIKSVKDGKTELKAGTDYTVSYRNNINSGKGTVIITAMPDSEYDGTKEVLFDITGLKITKAKVTGVVPKEFNGSGNITQAIANGTQNSDGVKLTYNVKESGKTVTKTLMPGTDFTVSYEKNNAAGSAKIVFTGKGLYNGTLKKGFKINKVKLTDDMRDKTPISITHSKGGAKPDVLIKYNGNTLINGKDYTLSYKNNKAVSSDTNRPMIIVKGKGSYSGTLKDIPFTIVKQAINNSTEINNKKVIDITASDAAYISGKSEYGTKVTIYDNGVKLSANKDYTIEGITGNQVTIWPESGYQTATVIINGIGNYDGTATVTFNIVEKLINSMSAQVTGVHVYSGAEVKLNKSEIVITDKKTGHTLTADEFSIKGYSKNDRVGTASVEIQGIGRYGGTKVIKFKINKK